MKTVLEILKHDGGKQERWSFELASVPEKLDKPIVYPNEDDFLTSGGIRIWAWAAFESEEEREQARINGTLGTSAR